MKIDEFLYKNRNYIFLPFILVGLVMSQPNHDLFIFGLLLVAFGELLRLMGISYTGTDSQDFDPANITLVTNGVYAHMRKPVFTGNMFICFGAIIGLNGWQPFLLWLGLFTLPAMYHLIARYEEKILFEIMGEPYKTYFEFVPRFYPKIIPFREKSNARPDFAMAVKSDIKMISGIVVVGILFMLRWNLFTN